MVFVTPPILEKNSIRFYTLKGHEVVINKYEDLYSYEVGFQRGTSYFPRFDDDEVKKYPVVSPVQAVNMLARNRLDVIIGKESVMDYFILNEGHKNKIEKAPFQHQNNQAVYLAISKKSNFAKRLPEFNNAMRSIKHEGKIDDIINQYLGK